MSHASVSHDDATASGPTANANIVALSFDSEHRLRSENLAFDIDVWYPALQPWTFPTVFIPLKKAEAISIRAFNDASWRHVSRRLQHDDIATLKRLEADIDRELRDLLGKFSGSVSAFVRLCGRSPKDGEPLNRKGVLERYERNLQQLLADGFDLTGNTKMIAISKTPYLQVTSGAEVMSLLLSSERCYADMIDWLRYGEPEQICLRLWEPEMTLDYEFRCFVCKGVLTAISQYDHYTFYNYLEAEVVEGRFAEEIYRLWKQIHPHIKEPSGSYIFDVAYLPKSKRFVLVELSPFAPCTGPATFHWEADRDVLERGRAAANISTTDSGSVVREAHLQPMSDGEDDECCIHNIVFRLRQYHEVHTDLDDLVEVNWYQRWREPFKPYYEYYESDNDDEKSPSSCDTGLSFYFIGEIYKWLWGPQPLATISAPVAPPPTYPAASSTEQCLLFVYGTLKKGFHWHDKYLHSRLGARFVGTGTTIEPLALVVGDSGVPYLLGDVTEEHIGAAAGHSRALQGKSKDELNTLLSRRHAILGEIWSVSSNALMGLDEYEGLGKGYYSRRRVAITVHSTELSDESFDTAEVYVLNESTAELLAKPFIEEYTLEMHQRLYQPIHHIQVKQLNYLKSLSSWGKTSSVIDGTFVIPNS